MSLQDRSRLVSVALIVALINTLDLASTYSVSPDLVDEWNVLERHLGLGWAGLWTAKAVGVALAVAGYAHYLRWRRWSYPPPGASLRTFCHDVTYGPAGVRQSPRDTLRRIAVNLGYFWVGMQALVVWVALDNLLLHWDFTWGIRGYSEMGYHMAQSAVVAAVVVFQFYAGNWREYQRMTGAAAQAAVANPRCP